MHSLTTNPVRFNVKIQSSVFQVFIISILVWVNRGICGRVQRLYRALCRAVLWQRTQHSVGLLDSCGFFYLVHTCCFKTHSKSWKKAWKMLHVDACVLSQLWLKNHNKDQTSNQQQSFFFSRITWLVCSIMSDLYHLPCATHTLKCNKKSLALKWSRKARGILHVKIQI